MASLRIRGAMRHVSLALLVGCLAVSLSQAAHAQSAPVCAITVTPGSGPAPLMVNANGGCSGSSPIVLLSVDWGDGSPPDTAANSPTISVPHTYTLPGTYTVTLTGTDSNALTGTATQNVTVTTPV